MSTATLEMAPIAESMPIPAPTSVPPAIPVPISVPSPGLVTPEDLLAMPDSVSYELVDGHLVERNVSRLSSLVAAEIVTQLTIHVKPQKLGWVFSTDLGYRCFPDHPGRVRKPDVSFIRLDRMSVESLREGYSDVAPDLAVEVISPNDLAEEVERKLGEYLGVGVPLVWIIYPEVRVARVHRLDGTAAYLRADDDLDGEAVLPGLRVRLADLLPDLPTPIAEVPIEVPSPS
jgi:Uma2 family endonuclease